MRGGTKKVTHNYTCSVTFLLPPGIKALKRHENSLELLSCYWFSNFVITTLEHVELILFIVKSDA